MSSFFKGASGKIPRPTTDNVHHQFILHSFTEHRKYWYHSLQLLIFHFNFNPSCKLNEIKKCALRRNGFLSMRKSRQCKLPPSLLVDHFRKGNKTPPPPLQRIQAKYHWTNKTGKRSFPEGIYLIWSGNLSSFLILNFPTTFDHFEPSQPKVPFTHDAEHLANCTKRGNIVANGSVHTAACVNCASRWTQPWWKTLFTWDTSCFLRHGVFRDVHDGLWQAK